MSTTESSAPELPIAFRLDGQVAVVTGGTSGIGRAIAEMLASAGATVAVLDLAAERDEPPAGTTLSRRVDISAPGELDEAAASIVEQIGVPTVVVASAGVSLERDALEISEDEWDHVVDVNLKGTFLTCQAFARQMLAPPAQDGSITIVASNFGLVGHTRRAPYVASKTGVVGLARALALEWAPQIRVNSVCPCLVRTPLVAERLQDPAYAERMVAQIPLRRFAEPTDVAAAVLFLSSRAAAMVTGHALAVDGGWVAQ
ncbi:MAG TPA: SDR family oxidoreductase [Solirubrobacteraceae bacterium]|jgi:2-deoxy-D-gluconate 3-dehydrogenase